MERTQLCEYKAGLWEGEKEMIVGCKNIKEAQLWLSGPRYTKVVLWPQTAKAKRFVSGRGDYIEITQGAVTYRTVEGGSTNA